MDETGVAPEENVEIEETVDVSDVETADPQEAPGAVEGGDGTEEAGEDTNPDTVGGETAPVVPDVEPEPYEVRALKQTFSADDLGLTGAKVRPDGVVEIPKEAYGRHQQLIGRGRSWETEYPKRMAEMEERVRQAQSQFDEDAERGKQLYKYFRDLANKSDQEIYDHVMEFKANLPLLRAQVERGLAEAERNRAIASPYSHEETMARVQNDANQAAWNHSLEVAKEFSGLTQKELSAIGLSLMERRQAYYVYQAQSDQPSANIRRGQYVFDGNRWSEDLRESIEAHLLKKAKQAPAKVAAKPAPKIPPVPGSPTGVAVKEPKIESYEDYEKYRRSLI